jgi:hypothetical protein
MKDDNPVSKGEHRWSSFMTQLMQVMGELLGVELFYCRAYNFASSPVWIRFKIICVSILKYIVMLELKSHLRLPKMNIALQMSSILEVCYKKN